jgi:hypothetical protein
MDKLKVYLKVLKKHHFWVLAAIVVIVSCSVWSSATGQLEADFKKNKQQVEGATSALTTIIPDAPNDTFKTGVENLQKELRKKVYSSWQEMYKQQQPRFVWPKGVEGIGRVRDEFIFNWDARFPGPAPATAPVVDANAAPAGPPKNPADEIKRLNTQTDNLRRFYRDNVIREELKRLFTVVRVRTERRRPAVDGKAPPRPRDAQDAAEYDGIVFWDEALRNSLTNRYYVTDPPPNDAPSLGRVLTTQEDLWILESMLRVIEKLNADANDPLAAVIKRIDALDVAQWAIKDAVADAGKIDRFTEARADLMAPGGGVGGPAGFEAPGAVAKTETEEDRWFHNRYLDEKMQPMNFNTPAPFAEFKQVFVRMRVLMDQRRAPELIAACANADLPIEIRQVLMALDDKTGTGRRPGAPQGPTGDKIDPGPYDGFVDIRGIVYIYNKPDESKVGRGAAGEPAKRPFGIPTTAAEIPAGGGPGARK